MTDINADQQYNFSFQITSAPLTIAPMVTLLPQNDIFSQKHQIANIQYLSTTNTQVLSTISSRERSPFRQGFPLAPPGDNLGVQLSNLRFGTAIYTREQRQEENDTRAFQRQPERTSPGQTTPKTILPEDVDLVYYKNEEDANKPLYPLEQQTQRYLSQHGQQPLISQESSESDEDALQHSYGTMASMGQESSSAGSVQETPRQYAFVPQSRRQPSSLSSVTKDFPSALTSMKSSSSKHAPETSEIKKSSGASAGTGTYTCTYHGCTLRVNTPAKLQQHKREHQNLATAINGEDRSGMTSRAQQTSQIGPHKCERVNPSTGKPCNTTFSRPYDLTRHESTIHNTRKQKLYCQLCTEEKMFSRSDALKRHLRIMHPEHVDLSRRRKNHE